MVECVSSALQGRSLLIAGILAPDTGSALAAGLAAKRAGAQVLLLLTPYYVSPSADGLVMHFRLVAEATGLPIIIYNNPGRTGINLDLPVLEHIAALPNMVGIKECDRDLGRVARKIDRLGSHLAFLSGDDDLCLPCFSLGAPGAIMASTNLVASWAVTIYRAARDGNYPEARAVFYSRLLKFIALYRGPDHPGPLKQIMEVVGIPVGTGRPPLQPLGKERLAQITQAVRELDLVEA